MCAVLQVDCRKDLWELLALMAKHQGQLKVNYTGSSSSSKAAGLLRGAVTAAAGAAVSAATAGAGGAATGDTDSKAGSASGTPKAGSAGPSPAAGAAAAADGAGDSELLKVLTPELGSAAGAASGMRILTHQVPEGELQSTAAEMQVGETLLGCCAQPTFLALSGLSAIC